MVVGIVSDLLEIIVTYTTPGVSLDILSSFVPLSTYNISVWKRKTIVESRGLVVDDDVVNRIRTAEGPRSDWYAYYLVQNKSYCGDLISIAVNSHVVINPIDCNVIFFAVFEVGNENVTVIQHANLAVTIGITTYLSINRKIRSAVKSDTHQVILYLIDEYGDCWEYITGYYPSWGQHGTDSLIKADAGKGVVSILPFPLCHYTLTRDGLIGRMDHPNEYSAKSAAPRLVGLYDVRHPKAITHNGLSIDIGNVPQTHPHTSVRKDLDANERYLSESITTNLSGVFTNYRVVRNYPRTSLASIAADRTAHYIYNTNTELPTTRHRTQAVEITHHAPIIAFAIVDPLTNEA